jgi:hypothetical protein
LNVWRIEAMLGETRETLSGTDLQAKQALLSKIVVRVDLGRQRGKITYTFPLRECADLYTVPPAEYEQQDR